MTQTITVSGNGRLSVPVELIELHLTLVKEDMEYDKTMALSAEALETLKKSLLSCGFKREEIKTGQFRIDRKTRSERNQDGEYQEIFTGYCCTHQLTVRFPFGTERLAEVLNALANCAALPHFTLSFTVNDPDTIKEQVLALAYEDAHRCATILAKAAGKTLGDIASIQYGSSRPIYISETACTDNMAKFSLARGAAMDIVPKEIESTETVSVVWQLQ